MNRLLPGILLVSVSLMLSACGGGGSTGDVDPVPPIQGLLKQVTGPAELEESLKSGFSVMRSAQEIADAQAAASPAGNFTGTYTQEARVDEFDAVRYDGSHLYVAPRRYFHCCFPVAQATGTSTPPERTIHVLATDPDN